MVGIYLVIVVSGCLLNNQVLVEAYRLAPRGEEAENHVGQGELGAQQEGSDDHDESKYPSNNYQPAGSNTNQNGQGTFNPQGGQGGSPTYQQGVGQGGYQQTPNQPTSNYHPNYHQGTGPYHQTPAYQQGAPYYNSQPPNTYYQGDPNGVLSHSNPEELVKGKSDAELFHLVSKALKEMKEIADSIMYWHYHSQSDNHNYHENSYNQGNGQQYYNPNQPFRPPYGYAQQNYGMPPPPQYQPMQPAYGMAPQQYVNAYSQQFFNQQLQPFPYGTLQYQRLIQHLYSYLHRLPGQPDFSQQYLAYKILSAPQQQGLNQLYPQQPQIGIPVTLPDSFAKSVLLQSLLPPESPYTSPVVHAPPGVVLVTPTNYYPAYTKLPLDNV